MPVSCLYKCQIKKETLSLLFYLILCHIRYPFLLKKSNQLFYIPDFFMLLIASESAILFIKISAKSLFQNRPRIV